MDCGEYDRQENPFLNKAKKKSVYRELNNCGHNKDGVPRLGISRWLREKPANKRCKGQCMESE